LSVNNIQGGSLRLLLRKSGKGDISPQAAVFLAEEQQSVLYDKGYLDNWKRRIEVQMAEFHRILRAHADKGATIIAYGAPTKAVLLMKMAGLSGGEVAFVVEDNVHKAGRFLPGTGVAIKSSSSLEIANPDVIVIFAWNFAGDIIDKLRGKFGRPVQIVVPLPELRTLQL
jgi:C-methyltransferase C-terminal domain